jgi:hypothetical protein
MHYSKSNQKILKGKYKGLSIGELIDRDPQYLRNLLMKDDEFTLSAALMKRLNKHFSSGSPIADLLNSLNDGKQNIEDRLEKHQYDLVEDADGLFEPDIETRHDYENDVWEERDNGEEFEE